MSLERQIEDQLIDKLQSLKYESEALTGCGRGNAVYDATQDAIFIDESLVNPVDFVNLGEETPHSNALTPDDIAVAAVAEAGPDSVMPSEHCPNHGCLESNRKARRQSSSNRWTVGCDRVIIALSTFLRLWLCFLLVYSCR